MAPRLLRRIVLVIFVGGIAGMVVGSIVDNNGVAITFGVVTAIAATWLLLSTALLDGQPSGHFDEQQAERVERAIHDLVDGGADEPSVRALVREAVRLGRTAQPPERPRRRG